MKTEKTTTDLNFSDNPLINIGIKILISLTFIILIDRIHPLFPLPFDSLFEFKWMFQNWKFIGLQWYSTEARFNHGIVPLLIVISLILLLNNSSFTGFKRYFLQLVIFSQIILFSVDIFSVIFNIGQDFFDPIWSRVCKFWGYTTLCLFLPFFLGNNLAKGLPEQYIDFVKRFFMSEKLKSNILKIFLVFTAISYIYEII